MPDYGFIVRDFDNSFRIDGLHQHFVVFDSGTWTRPGGVYSPVSAVGITPITFATPTYSGSPIVAIRPRSASVSFRAGIKSYIRNEDGLFTGFNLSWRYFPYPRDDYVDWVLFIPVPSTHQLSDDYGMNIFGPDGSLVFASNSRLMGINNIYTINDEHPYDTYGSAPNRYISIDSIGALYSYYFFYPMIFPDGSIFNPIPIAGEVRCETGRVLVYWDDPVAWNDGTIWPKLVEATA